MKIREILELHQHHIIFPSGAYRAPGMFFVFSKMTFFVKPKNMKNRKKNNVQKY